VPGAFLSNLFAGAVLHAAGATKHLAAISNGEKTATVALLESSASWDPKRGANADARRGKTIRSDAESADYRWSRRATRAGFGVVPVEGHAVKKTLMPAMDWTRRLYKVAFDHPAAELLAKGDAASKAPRSTVDMWSPRRYARR